MVLIIITSAIIGIISYIISYIIAYSIKRLFRITDKKLNKDYMLNIACIMVMIGCVLSSITYFIMSKNDTFILCERVESYEEVSVTENELITLSDSTSFSVSGSGIYFLAIGASHINGEEIYTIRYIEDTNDERGYQISTLTETESNYYIKEVDNCEKPIIRRVDIEKVTNYTKGNAFIDFLIYPFLSNHIDNPVQDDYIQFIVPTGSIINEGQYNIDLQ